MQRIGEHLADIIMKINIKANNITVATKICEQFSPSHSSCVVSVGDVRLPLRYQCHVICRICYVNMCMSFSVRRVLYSDPGKRLCESSHLNRSSSTRFVGRRRYRCICRAYGWAAALDHARLRQHTVAQRWPDRLGFTEPQRFSTLSCICSKIRQKKSKQSVHQPGVVNFHEIVRVCRQICRVYVIVRV